MKQYTYPNLAIGDIEAPSEVRIKYLDYEQGFILLLRDQARHLNCDMVSFQQGDEMVVRFIANNAGPRIESCIPSER